MTREHLRTSRGGPVLAALATLFATLTIAASGPPDAVNGAESWTQRGFEDLSTGTFGDAGQNIYVSAAHGRIQLINRTDLNQDGFVDIAIGNGHPKTEKEDAFVYLNRGGDFNAHDRVALPTDGAYAPAVADLNRDGYNELILAQRDNGISPRLNAFIYLGGAEGFSAKRRLELPAFAARDVAVGDFDDDGWIDLAFACSNVGSAGTVSTVYWNSSGAFDANHRQDFAGAQWERVHAADWDGDGTSDLLASTKDGVLLFQVERTQRLGEQTVTPAGGESIAVADWNGDKLLDLAVSDRRSVKLYLHGSGAAPAETFAIANASAVAAADFDRDGRPDLLVAVKDTSGNEFSDSLILWNDAGGFDRRERARLPTVNATATQAADLDGDGYPEAIFANQRAYNENNIESFVYWNSGGHFYRGRKTMLDTRGATGVAVGDVNKDGAPDLIFANSNGDLHEGLSPNYIYWGNGTRDYSVARRTDLPAYYTTGSVQADLDDDGWVDLGFNEGRFAAGRPGTLHGLHLFWGGPNGFSVERRSILSVFDPAGGVKAADLDRNGWLDLIVGANDTDGGKAGGFVIFWGGSDGFSIRRRQPFPVGSEAREPLVADLNGDGYLDLAAPPTEMNGLFIYWGAAQGFDTVRPTTLGMDRQFAHPEAADLNGDGFIDLIAPTRKFNGDTEADSFVYYGSPAGFSETRRIGLPTMAGYDPSVADLNKDGWLDIVFPNYSATQSGKRTLPVFIYWGSANGFDVKRRQSLPADAGTGTMIVDFDGDGWRDLYVACHRRDGSRDEAGRPHVHRANSLIYWNGPDGFLPDRRTEFPSVGPHAQVVRDVGNIMTREMAEYYTSRAWKPSLASARVQRIRWDADTPHGTSIGFQVRAAATESELKAAQWTGPQGRDSWFDTSGASVALSAGPWVQYRARLFTPNGGSTPLLRSVTLDVK